MADDLGLKLGDLPEVTELWRTGPNQIVVWVHPDGQDARQVRITAHENLRSGASGNYWAHYETVVTVKDESGRDRDVWANADYPWQDGETVEECLRAALLWAVNPH